MIRVHSRATPRRGACLRARTLVVLTLVSLLGTLAWGPVGVAQPETAGAAHDDFVNGSGRAAAQLIRVGPSAARLSLAPAVGLSLADYLGTTGRGEALMIDYVALDGSIPPELKEQTASVRVDSIDEGASDGRSRTTAGTPDESPVRFGAMTQAAKATDAPLGESSVTLGSFTVPGVIEVSGGVARASAGLVAERLRQAHAVTEIGSISLGGGAATLTGLRWEAVQRSGARSEVAGSFRIEGASVGGVELGVPAGGAELETVLDAVNQALAPTGLSLRAPRVETRSDVARVSPLALVVADSQIGNQLLAPVIGALQPVRDPITSELIEQSDGELSAAILVADIMIGVFTGASSFAVELGGADAFTEGQRFESPFGPGRAFPPAPAETITSRGDPGGPGIPGSPGQVVPGETRRPLIEREPLVSTRIPGSRAGRAALMIALIGVLATVAVAGADWFRMRTAPVVPAPGASP